MSELEDAPIALTAQILRNKGVPVTLARVTLVEEEDEWGDQVSEWRPQVFGDAPVVSERHVRFNTNAFADVEEKYGSLKLFEEAMREKSYSTTRTALAICWNWDERRVGASMLSERTNEYTTAVGVAMAIANGVDPTKAARMLQIGFAQMAEAQASTDADADKMIADAEAEMAEAEKAKDQPPTTTSTKTTSSTGDSGSPTSSPLAAVTTSSGD